MLSLFTASLKAPQAVKSAFQRRHPPFNFPTKTAAQLPMPSQLNAGNLKPKVVFVMGATGTGKSKLAIKLAAPFGGEIVNSDKMQVYDALHVVSNKVSDAELAAVPHHLIGGVHTDADFTADDFRRAAMLAIDDILARGRLPIIAGGSNNYIEQLVDGEGKEFMSKYEACFLWVDVELPALHVFVVERVDKMVEMGLVDEVRALYDPAADYTRGVRRSIGVPEMDQFFRAEAAGADSETLAKLMSGGIHDTKVNTCKLICNQLRKIHRLRTECGWEIHRLDATEVFEKRKEWEAAVAEPAIELVRRFLVGEGENIVEKNDDRTNEFVFNGTEDEVLSAATVIARFAIAAKVSTMVEPMGATV